MTKEECRDIDSFVYDKAPHYELEDGTILYAKWGAPGAGEVWWEQCERRK